MASFSVRIRVRIVRQLSVDEVSQGARVVRKVEIDGQLSKVLEVDRLLIPLRNKHAMFGVEWRVSECRSYFGEHGEC